MYAIQDLFAPGLRLVQSGDLAIGDLERLFHLPEGTMLDAYEVMNFIIVRTDLPIEVIRETFNLPDDNYWR